MKKILGGITKYSAVINLLFFILASMIYFGMDRQKIIDLGNNVTRIEKDIGDLRNMFVTHINK